MVVPTLPCCLQMQLKFLPVSVEIFLTFLPLVFFDSHKLNIVTDDFKIILTIRAFTFTFNSITKYLWISSHPFQLLSSVELRERCIQRLKLQRRCGQVEWILESIVRSRSFLLPKRTTWILGYNKVYIDIFNLWSPLNSLTFKSTKSTTTSKLNQYLHLTAKTTKNGPVMFTWIKSINYSSLLFKSD